jgi:hypothetical protein
MAGAFGDSGLQAIVDERRKDASFPRD